MRKIKSGIYQILGPDNHIYIGSTKNFSRRFYAHRYALKRNEHRNLHLQQAYNKYGLESFKFEKLELISDARILQEREQYYLDQIFKDFNRENIYNVCEEAYRPSSLARSAFSSSSRIKTHYFYDMKLEQEIVIENLPKFCKENKLDYTSMLGVSCGFRESCRNFVNISAYKNRDFTKYRTGPHWRMPEIKNVAKSIYQKYPRISCRKLVKELTHQNYKISPTTAARFIKEFKRELENEQPTE